MCQSIFPAFRNKLDKVEHALHDAALELVTTLVPQNTTQERQHASLLAGELKAQCPNGLNNGNLEFIRSVGHEARDLLHETVNTGFVSGLEQCSDGEGCDGAVGVGDQRLDIGVADIDDMGFERREVVKDSDCGELADRTWGREEQLQNMNSLGGFGIRDITHFTDSLGSLKVDHLVLVSEPAIKHLHHRFPQSLVLLCQLSRQPHQQYQRRRTLHHPRSSVLLHHLDQSHPVVRTHLVQKTNGMILGHEIRLRDCVGLTAAAKTKESG